MFVLPHSSTPEVGIGVADAAQQAPRRSHALSLAYRAR